MRSTRQAGETPGRRNIAQRPCVAAGAETNTGGDGVCGRLSPPVQSNPPRIKIHLKSHLSIVIPTCVASVLESSPLSAPLLELESAPLSAPLLELESAPLSAPLFALAPVPGANFHTHTAPSSRDGRANPCPPCAPVNPERACSTNAR
jgi:hypothetical protein